MIQPLPFWHCISTQVISSFTKSTPSLWRFQPYGNAALNQPLDGTSRDEGLCGKLQSHEPQMWQGFILMMRASVDAKDSPWTTRRIGVPPHAAEATAVLHLIDQVVVPAVEMGVEVGSGFLHWLVALLVAFHPTEPPYLFNSRRDHCIHHTPSFTIY